jgi:hypothetical protein
VRVSTAPLKPIAAALLGAGCALNAAAASFELGPFEATLRSNLSVGASWRADDPSNRVLTPGNTDGRGKASSGTTDDGNLNYQEGDMYSLLFRGLHDLDLNAGNWGAFVRLKYWYDYALANDNVRHGHAANDYASGEELETNGFEPLAQDKGFEFLDYYLYGSFEAGDMPVELRAGNMALNWGEATFIQNGVNVISPFDVTAVRRPGTEIREALLPVGMVYANVGLTYDLTVEAFYQYEWQRTILDECGTYWSSADPYGGGCDYLTVSAAQPDGAQVGTIFELGRAPDITPDDGGQYGIAARYFVDALNGTEFGAYYINYHSRTPIFSAINTPDALGQPILNPLVQPQYVFEFPEDIEVYALTFATNVGFWAVSGELSYRPDFPLQINTVDFLSALALGGIAEWSPMLPRSLAAGPGGHVAGYDDVEYTQAQVTFIRFFEQVFGADRLSFAAEVGSVWVDGMEPGVNYGRSPTYGSGYFEPFPSQVYPGAQISCTEHPLAPLIVPNPTLEYCSDDGFTTSFSWGYRARAALEYNNAIAGVNLIPSVAWSHDVDGYSPAPNFVEGRQALSLALRADYLNIYQAEISFTSFFGADYNELADRDFLTLSFSVAF